MQFQNNPQNQERKVLNDKQIWENKLKTPESKKSFEIKGGIGKKIKQISQKIPTENKELINVKNKIFMLEKEIKELKFIINNIQRQQRKIGSRVNETTSRQEETQRQFFNTD
jgi:SMC interacting uncharacterized protein involved in chromosome segregation